MRRALLWLIAVAVLAGAAGWLFSRPYPVPADRFAGLTGDVARGETVFWASGCASCHAAPDATEETRTTLAGGYRIQSPFGTFVAPNISPSAEGIGGWSVADLGQSLLSGVSPSGRHYYPSFPYTSYMRMTAQDVADLKAFLDTLPPSDRISAPHDLRFPVTIRRGLGLWKRVGMRDDWVLAEVPDAQTMRGRYLVEALAHCAECHTPRTVLGTLDRSRWMEGAPNPSGDGRIPAIDPATLDWSADDIAYYLKTGFTPEFDSAGGHMARVVQNMARLTDEDRQAIAVYLKALP